MPEKQMSDSLLTGLLLAFAGGILDAYSFVNRGGVFATAETGNIVQLCVHLSRLDLWGAVHYLLPIVAFISGIFAAEAIHRHMQRRPQPRLHWRQPLLLAECLVVAVVALLPLGEFDNLANILIAFTSAVQLEAFRKFRGCAAATTMCTGNLRSGSELLYRFLALPEPGAAAKASVYYQLIGAFVAGAVVCGRLSLYLGGLSALLACFPLLAAFFLLFRT